MLFKIKKESSIRSHYVLCFHKLMPAVVVEEEEILFPWIPERMQSSKDTAGIVSLSPIFSEG
jgi:hypothetical protein